VGSLFVRRVSLVGVSGSGKSSLGRDLAARLVVPFAELDAIFHQPDWTPLAEDQFRRRVTATASGDGWVIDGNYSAVRPLVWERADSPPMPMNFNALITISWVASQVR
jgi:adenylate kinase family enzyme